MQVHCVQKVDSCVVRLPHSNGDISYQRVMIHTSACLGSLPKVLAIYIMQFLETLVVLDRSLQLVVSSFFFTLNIHVFQTQPPTLVWYSPFCSLELSTYISTMSQGVHVPPPF